MKTLLIKPNTKKTQYGVTEHLSAVEMPLWLMMMANCYEHPSILDAEAEHLNRNEVVEIVMRSGPKQVIILATGSHPSAHIQQKDEADKLAMDIKYAGFIGAVEVYDKLIFNPIKSGPINWNLVNPEAYRAHNWHCWGGRRRTPYASVFTSISCPYHCEFCCIKSFYGSEYKTRPVKEFVQDVYTLHENYGVSNFKIMDELFAINTRRLSDMSDRLKEIGPKINIWAYARIDTVTPENLKIMRQMGITWLAYGIESGNDEIRQSIMKGKFDKNKIRDVIQMTKDAGIHTLGNYMFGFWEDTKITMEETLAFAKELNCEYANFYCTVAYPGSKLYDDMKAKGVRLPERSEDYSQMSSTFCPLPTKTVSAKDILDFRDEAFIEYFSNVDYLKSLEKTFGPQVLVEVADMMKVQVTRAST